MLFTIYAHSPEICRSTVEPVVTKKYLRKNKAFHGVCSSTEPQCGVFYFFYFAESYYGAVRLF